jgi:hypothetical protein
MRIGGTYGGAGGGSRLGCGSACLCPLGTFDGAVSDTVGDLNGMSVLKTDVFRVPESDFRACRLLQIRSKMPEGSRTRESPDIGNNYRYNSCCV